MITEGHAAVLAQALSRLLGAPEPGTVAYLRCLSSAMVDDPADVFSSKGDITVLLQGSHAVACAGGSPTRAAVRLPLKAWFNQTFGV